jgi:hypothetical protein
MTRGRPLIVAGSVAAAIIAGVWTGGAAGSASQRTPDAAALARLDAARVRARAALGTATTPANRHVAARGLADVYRRTAPALPDQRRSLHDGARAYDALATASAPAAYATAADRVQAADAALAVALRRPPGAPAEPLVPPALPLVLLVSAAAGAAVASRRRRAETPSPQLQPAPTGAGTPHWDTPPADYAESGRAFP